MSKFGLKLQKPFFRPLLIFCLSLVFAFLPSVAGAASFGTYSTHSNRVAVINLDTGDTIFSENADKRAPIASLTKIMTAYLATKDNPDISQKITITSDMVKVNREFVTAGLYVGQVVTLEDLLYLTMLPSAGDAAQALAISTSGSLDSFIKLMNTTATDTFHLKNTHFTNVLGYDDGNYSTASDIAAITVAALKNPTFRQVFESNEHYSASLGRKIKKTLSATAASYGYDFSPISGAKTGFTNAAGRCLASTSTAEDGTHLLLITLGAKSPAGHLEDALSIYKYYNNNYKSEDIVTAGSSVFTLPVKSAHTDTFDVIAPATVSKYLPKNHEKIEIRFIPAGELINKDGKSFSELPEDARSITVEPGSTTDGAAITSATALDSPIGEVSYILDGEELYSFTATLSSDPKFINYPLIISIVVGFTLLGAFIFTRKFVKANARTPRNLPKIYK